MTAAWFLWGELWSNRHGLRVDALDWAGMLLVGWLLLSLVWSPAPRRGLVDASLLVGAFAVFAAARSLWSLPGAMVVSVWSLALACLVLALWALGQWMAVGGEPVAGVGNQNFLAGLLAAQLPFALVGLWILHDKGRLGGGFRFMLLEALLVLVVMAAIAVTHSRAGLAAGVVALVVWYVRPGGLVPRFRILRWGLPGFAVVLLVGGLVWFGGSGVNGRLYLAEISVRLIREALWFGHGLGAYATVFPSAQGAHLAAFPGDRALWTNAWSAHCEPLQLWIEGGIVAVGLATLFLGLAIRSAVSSRTDVEEPDETAGVVRWAAAAGLIALSITMFTEAVFHQPAQAGLGALLAGLIVGRRPDRGGPRESVESDGSGGAIHQRVGAWAGRWVLGGLVVAGLAGASVCSVRQYLAERVVGRALRVKASAHRVESLRRAVALACDDGPAMFRLGLALDESGLLAEGLHVLAGARERRPDAIRTLALGNLLLRSGRVEEAVTSFRLALRLHPRLAAGYYNLAVALEAAGRDEEARRAFARAHSLLPGRYPRPRPIETTLPRDGRGGGT